MQDDQQLAGFYNAAIGEFFDAHCSAHLEEQPCFQGQSSPSTIVSFIA
jgi:hypothetical protein